MNGGSSYWLRDPDLSAGIYEGVQRGEVNRQRSHSGIEGL